jgi:hypothetical protein
LRHLFLRPDLGDANSVVAVNNDDLASGEGKIVYEQIDRLVDRTI